MQPGKPGKQTLFEEPRENVEIIIEKNIPRKRNCSQQFNIVVIKNNFLRKLLSP